MLYIIRLISMANLCLRYTMSGLILFWSFSNKNESYLLDNALSVVEGLFLKAVGNFAKFVFGHFVEIFD